MFSTNRNIKTLEELVTELKRYFLLQKRFIALEFVSKLIVLLAALVLGTVLFLVGSVIVILLAFCAASYISDLTGSMTLGFAVVSALFLLIAIIIYANRKRWITLRITNFLSNLLLKKDDDERK